MVLPGSVGDSRGDSRAVCVPGAGARVGCSAGTPQGAVSGVTLQCPGLHSPTGALPEPARLGKLSHLFQPGHEHLSICVHPEVLSWMHLAARLERIFTGAESSL